MLYTISVIFCSSGFLGLMYPRENIQSCHTEHCSRQLVGDTNTVRELHHLHIIINVRFK